MLQALESIGSRCSDTEPTDENGRIRLEFAVTVNSSVVEGPILEELGHELDDDCEEEMEEIDLFLESQPDPHEYASYRIPDRTLYID